MKHLLVFLLLLPVHAFALSCFEDPDWKPDLVVRGTVTEVTDKSGELGFSKVYYAVVPEGDTAAVTIAHSLWYSKSTVKEGGKYEFKAYKDPEGVLTIGPCQGSIEPIE